jgi:beta-galactosidase
MERNTLCWPGGYRDKGYVDLISFKQNCRQQLIEMIRQNMNHPSVLFWGLFNELTENGDNPVAFIKELNSLAHAEDPSRLTTCASNQNGAINKITDLAAWNKYPGWYGGNVSAIADWADAQHAEMPNTPIGISEYGAGASIYHQNEELIKTDPGSYWHPENWQTHYHEEYWKVINERPFLWGTFIWNLFDFGAAHRTEGEIDGKNDKGIVTFDRKVKKDAFYFYKANWNKSEPLVYIAERRLVNRTQKEQTIKVYSNQSDVLLYVNNKKYTPSKTDDYCCFYFDVVLEAGENQIVATSKKKITDKVNVFLID